MASRIPANLCKAFCELLNSNDVVRIGCFSLNQRPILSEKPPAEHLYKRNPEIHRKGGGGIISCKYVLYCYGNRYDIAVDALRSILKKLQFQGTESLDIENEQGDLKSCPG